MSTRGIIARKTEDGWEGVYHHWDSYPEGLGRTLYELYHGHFQRDMANMMHMLIDEHRAGWSTINDRDFSQEPGFIEFGYEMEAGDSRKNRPQCYCHGDRHGEPIDLYTHADTDIWCEYAYALDPETTTMQIWKKSFGKHWEYRTTVDLVGPTPDWTAVLAS